MKNKTTRAPERMTPEQLDSEILRLIVELDHAKRQRMKARLNRHDEVEQRRLAQDIEAKNRELHRVQIMRARYDAEDERRRIERFAWTGVNDDTHVWRTRE